MSDDIETARQLAYRVDLVRQGLGNTLVEQAKVKVLLLQAEIEVAKLAQLERIASALERGAS